MSQSVKDKSRNERKIRTGIVVNNRMKKTIIVQVVRLVKHPLYPRIVKRFSKFKAHDEDNTAKMGDWVKIMETRRFSKDKRWRLFSIVKHASTAPSLPEPASEQLASDLRAEK